MCKYFIIKAVNLLYHLCYMELAEVNIAKNVNQQNRTKHLITCSLANSTDTQDHSPCDRSKSALIVMIVLRTLLHKYKHFEVLNKLTAVETLHFSLCPSTEGCKRCHSTGHWCRCTCPGIYQVGPGMLSARSQFPPTALLPDTLT